MEKLKQIPMNETGTVYRSIDELALSDKAMALARKLLESIDLCVVYLIGSNKDKNYRIRHDYQHNSFWISVKEGTSQEEMERLILSGLYIAYTETNREAGLTFTDDYCQKLLNENEQKKNKARNLMSKIDSSVVTIETNCFLTEYGFQTKKDVMDEHFNRWMKQLFTQIIFMRHNRNIWKGETFAFYLLEMGCFSEYDLGYDIQISEMIKTIPDVVTRIFCENYVPCVKNVFSQARADFMEKKDGARSAAMQSLINLLSLKDKFKICYPYYYEGEYPVSDYQKEPVISFLPNNTKDDFLEKCFMIANECIIGIQNMYLAEGKKAPDPHFNLILSTTINGYSDGNKKEGYYISVTAGLFNAIAQRCSQLMKSYPTECNVLMSSEQMYDKLFKFSIYWIIAHEFAHIVNGDCDSHFANDNATVSLEQRKREDRKADEVSIKMVYFAAALSSERHKRAITNHHELAQEDLIDLSIIEQANSVAKGLRCECGS